MGLTDTFNSGFWQDKVLEADKIWLQVKTALDNDGLTLPKTPRRPFKKVCGRPDAGKTL